MRLVGLAVIAVWTVIVVVFLARREHSEQAGRACSHC